VSGYGRTPATQENREEVGAPPHWQPIPLRSIGCQCGGPLLRSGLLQTNLYTTTDSKPRTQLDTDETYKKTKELQLHNIERSWETKRDQLLALLSQQESALRSATQPIATTTLPNNDSLITTLTVAQSTAKHEKWLRDNSKNLTIEIIQVIDKGVLADNMKLQVVASSSARVGMGGGVGSYYGRSGKIIFVDGLKGMAEQQRKDIVAAPDGTYTYTDVSGASRTVEKWTFIKNQ